MLSSFLLLLGDSARLASGRAMSQIIGLATIPIVARMFGPEAYGNAAYLWTLVTIFVVVAALKLEPSIVLEKSEGNASALVFICVALSLVYSLLVVALLIVSNSLLGFLPGAGNLSLAILLVALGIFFMSAQKISERFSVRANMLSLFSILLFIGAILGATYKILAGFMWPENYLHITVGNVIQFMPLALFLLYVLFGQFKKAKFESVFELVKRYSHFPKQLLPSELLNVLAGSVPVIIITQYFGAHFAGVYAVAWALLMRPLSIIGDSLGMVYLKRANALKAQGKLFADVLLIQAILFAFLVVPIILLALFRNTIVEFIFGSEWLEAAEIILVLIPFVVIAFVNKPLIQSIVCLERLDVLLYYNIASILLRIGGLVLGLIYMGDFLIGLILFSVLSVIANLGVMVAGWILSRRSDQEYRYGI